jgi:hypothetical protein
MTPHPRTKRRPPSTTPALRALVNRVQELIDTRGMNYTSLADQTGFSRSHVKSLAEGRVLSLAGYTALDKALRANGTLLRMRLKAVEERDAARHGHQTDEPPDATEHIAAHPTEAITTNRRDLFALLGAGTTLAALPTLTPTDRLIQLEGTARADSILSIVEAQIAACASSARTMTPVERIAELAGVQQLIDGISANLTLRPADSARLWHAATITAGLRGWIYNGQGDTSAARVSLAEAYKRADLLDDDRLIAWTRYMQSRVEDYAGNPSGAMQYANDGLRHARTGPQRALLLADGISPLYADRGDTQRVRSAISDALEIVDSLSLDEHGPASRTVVDDLNTVHPLFVSMSASLAYSRLGLAEKAQEVARPIITSGDSDYRPYVVLDEALAVARGPQRDPERIGSLVGQGLSLAQPFQTGHVGMRVKAIQAAVKPIHGHPAIGDMIDNTRTWQQQHRTLPA